jgi:glycosyltransferase 2 family protein
VGSPAGLPSGEEVRALLGTVGLQPASVIPTPHQTWGAAHYRVDMGAGDALAVSFYGRDATDAQLLTKLWRFAFYRHSGAALALTRIQQVKHESSITQLAARSGARVPEVLIASTLCPSRDAVVITRAPAGEPLAELDHQRVTDAHLDDLFTQMLKLRSAAISHGAVSPRTIVVDPARETATLVDFRNGTSAASAFILDQDLAGAMASAALAAGPQRTAASAGRVLPAGPLTGALGHLRRAGLDPAVNVGLKGKKELLDQLRTTTAQAAHISVPELAEPRRMSWSQVLVAAGTLIGGWALALTLINAAHSISTIRSAQWGWVAATLILCAASFFGTAWADLGSVPGSLAYGRAVGLEVASTFTVLAGGGAAVVATDVRFLQQQGYSATAAVTSGAVVSAASFVVKGALFLIAIPLAWSSFHFGNSLHQDGHSRNLVLILAIVCAIGTVMAVVLAVPRWRQRIAGKLRPKLATARDNFTQLASQPSKIAQLFGGQLAAQLVPAGRGPGSRRSVARLRRAPIAGCPAHRGHHGRRPGLRLPGRGRHGRGRSRPDPGAHRRRHHQERRNRRRVRPAPLLRLPPAHRRLVHPHVDAQKGIPVTCPSQRHAEPHSIPARHLRGRLRRRVPPPQRPGSGP